MPVISHKHGRNHLHFHVPTSTVRMELTIAMTALAAVLAALAFNGGVALLTALPAYYLFNRLSLPLAYMITGEGNPEVSRARAMRDLKTEHNRVGNLETKYRDHHARVTSSEWICACGQRNPLNWNLKIQNCSKCFRSRDFVLANYAEDDGNVVSVDPGEPK